MNETYDTIEYKGFNINVFHDENTESPREWCNAGTMYTMHRNYQPDEDFYKHFEWEEVFDERRNLLPEFEEKYVALKFYLYDHSGLSVAVEPFGCQWDSGLFGIIAMPVEAAKLALKCDTLTPELRAVAESWLRAEVETYGLYLRSEVYGYTITECENERNRLDASCWGFYGDDGIAQLTEEAKCFIDQYLQDPMVIKRAKVLKEIEQYAKAKMAVAGVEAELTFSY